MCNHSQVRCILQDAASGFDEATGGALYINIIKSAWIVYCLGNHQSLKSGATGLKLITSLLARVSGITPQLPKAAGIKSDTENFIGSL